MHPSAIFLSDDFLQQQNTALRAEIDNARDEQALKRSDLEILQAELRVLLLLPSSEHERLMGV